MDTVIAYDIVVAHIIVQANAAAKFWSLMQTNTSQSLELKLLDSILKKQLDIDMEAKTPDASMLSIDSSAISNDIRQPKKPRDLLEQLKANDALKNSISDLNHSFESASPKETNKIFGPK